MTHVLIPLNRKNLNGRTYRPETFNKEFDKEYLVELRPSDEVCATPDIALEHTKGVIRNVRIEGDNVIGELEMLQLPLADFVKEQLDAGLMVIRPKSTAKVSDIGEITDAVLMGFQFIQADKDSFLMPP